MRGGRFQLYMPKPTLSDQIFASAGVAPEWRDVLAEQLLPDAGGRLLRMVESSAWGWAGLRKQDVRPIHIC